MTRVERLSLALAAGTMTGAAAETRYLQAPRYVVSVRNATTMPLTCRAQVAGGRWERLVIGVGQEWQQRVPRTNASVSMSCAAPVRQIAFRLTPGRRYVLLRDGKDSSVDLRAVTSPR